MNKTELMNKASRFMHKTGYKLKKHSPEILMVAGVVGTVTGTVLACKATLKVNEVLDEAQENIEKIHEAEETGVTQAGSEYTLEDGKKDLSIVYLQTGLKVAKMYAPAVIVTGLSLTAMISSNIILRKRNAALLAAYTTLDKTFKGYRKRVVERFGEDLDRELRYNIKAVEVEEKTTKEDGTEETTTKTVQAVDPNTVGDFTFMYDDGCRGWTKDPEANKLFLKSQERYANHALQSRGYLFLNDVLEMLGFQRTSMGQIVGWIYCKDGNNPDGDNFVDFGLLDVAKPKVADFNNGYERSVLLNFNVDGPIVDKI